MADIAGFLATDAGGAIFVIAQCQHFLGRQFDGGCRQTVIGGPRRGQRHLLFEDQQYQCLKPERTPPDGRFAEFRYHCTQVRVALC